MRRHVGERNAGALVDAGSAIDSKANGALEASVARRKPWWRDSLRRRYLAAADAVAGLAAGIALVSSSDVADASQVLGLAVAFTPVWILAAKLYGLYDRDHRALRHLTVDEIAYIALWGLTGVSALAATLSFVSPGSIHVAAAVAAWALACALAFGLRSAARSLWRRATPPERTVIIGNGALAGAIQRKLQLFPDMHLEVVRAGSDDDRLPEGVERVIVASAEIDERRIVELLGHCRAHAMKLSILPPIRAMFGTAVQLDHVADLPVVQYNTWDVSRSTLLLKRGLDVALASLGLVVLSPVLLAVAVAVWADGRPVIFTQTRAGLGGRPFRMLKFRTMVPDAERLLGEIVDLDGLPEPVFKLHHDPRVTPVGRFLRRTSLDELPQLVNVVKGEMSLVGPRPEQVDLVARYTPEERFRLAVKPGVTGPMQVNGRGELRFDERLAVEREYIENLSLGRDLRIIALTLASVVSGKGAY